MDAVHNAQGKPPVFQFSRVSKIYPMGDSEVRALDELELKIAEGDYSAILGPSGSGKSTLMHIMGFMDTPTSGTVLFDGEDVSNLRPSRRARYRAERIGFVFQTFNLLPRLTVLENTMLPLRYLRMSAREAKEKARVALAAVDLNDREKHYPNQLSGGQRQRVAVARAIVNRPRLILADEPTGNLDTENANLILKLFEELVDEGRTLVLVTHDHDIADRTHNRITIRDGKAV